MTILLVEDEILVREYLREALVAEGFEVVAVSTGEHALAELRNPAVRYKAIITDIRLADKIPGWDVAKLARDLIPAVPIVYMTGDSAADWKVHGVPDSILLAKPFEVPHLLATVGALVESGR
jgi:DNA-binding response OmpR family regulator